MNRKLCLNNEVSEIVKITPRQVQSWTDKGLVKPFREASGGGSKRGYDYINKIELYICKTLLNNGQGIQSVKTILNSLREKDMLRQWIESPSVYFTKLQQNLSEIIRNRIDYVQNMDIETVEELEDSFFNMFLGDPTATYAEQPATLIYFFSIDMGKVLQKGFSIILPGVELDTTHLTTRACSYLYVLLTSYPGAIVVNISEIRRAIDKAILDKQGIKKIV